MGYCPNCGAETEQSAKICEFCGYSLNFMDELKEKNLKINQLKQKLHQHESTRSYKGSSEDNSQLKYFWVIAALMIIGFFSFIFYFVYMASHG